MSSEDFRARLYYSLRRSGILETMKSQLRNKLASELHVLMKTSALGSPPAKSSQDRTTKCMLVQVTESMVARYLHSTGYEYTLSTFLPEAGICMDELVSEEDLMCFLRISPSSSIHDQLQAKMKKQGNFLEGLLEALIATHGGGYTASVEASSQVLPEQLDRQKFSPENKSVELTLLQFQALAREAYKLEALDEVYARKVEEEALKCTASLEDRLATVQTDLEACYKSRLDTEMSLYQERELAKVRREERDRYHDKLDKEKEELQNAYHLRLENVKKSEKNLAEIYHRKEMDLEAGIFSQRQVLLNELNALKVKEAGLKRQAELDNRAMDLERERVKAMNEQLEKSLQQIKVHFELIAREKTQKQEKQIQDVTTRWEKEHNVGMEALSSQQQKIQRLVEELSQEKKTVEAMQSQLKEVSMEKAALQRQKDNAEVKLNQVPHDDDHQLKCKVAELQKQLSDSESKRNELKSSHKQQQNNIKQLQAQLSQPSPDLIATRDKLAQLHETHHKQLLVLEYDKKQLGRQLDLQMEHGLQLQKRLDEQLLQLKSAQHEMEDLHTLLEHKFISEALQGFHKGHEKETSASAHSPSKRTRPAKSSPLQQKQKHHTAQAPFQTSSPDITGDVATPSKENTFNIHGSFLSESKAAISRIEKEAEELEKAYQHFHMTSSAMSPGQKNNSRHNNYPQDQFHHDLNLSPLQHSCFNAPITPMDYLKAQQYTIMDAPHHSTAQQLFSFSTCNGRTVFTTSSSMIFTNTPSQPQQPMAAAQVATVTSSLCTAQGTGTTLPLISGNTTPALISGTSPALISGTANPALISGTATPALISGTATPALISGTSPALISGTPTPALISGTPTPALISGTATPALISGTPTPALISGTPTPALISGTANPALISGTATPALISGTAIPALISGTATPALISGTATPALISGTAVPTSATVRPSAPAPLKVPVLPITVDREAVTFTTTATVAESETTNDTVSSAGTSLVHESLDSFKKPPPEMVSVIQRNQVAPLCTTTMSFGTAVSTLTAEAPKETTLPVSLQGDDKIKEETADEPKKHGGNGEKLQRETVEHSELNREQPIEEREVSSPPDSSLSNRGGVGKKKKSDDGMDPIMLKYMMIVEEKRKSEKQPSSQLHRKQAIGRRGFQVKKDLDGTQLSESDSFGCDVPSDQDDNPFEGW